MFSIFFLVNMIAILFSAQTTQAAHAIAPKNIPPVTEELIDVIRDHNIEPTDDQKKAILLNAPYYQDQHGNTLLHIACAYENIGIIRYICGAYGYELLSKKNSVNVSCYALATCTERVNKFFAHRKLYGLHATALYGYTPDFQHKIQKNYQEIFTKLENCEITDQATAPAIMATLQQISCERYDTIDMIQAGIEAHRHTIQTTITARAADCHNVTFEPHQLITPQLK